MNSFHCWALQLFSCFRVEIASKAKMDAQYSANPKKLQNSNKRVRKTAHIHAILLLRDPLISFCKTMGVAVCSTSDVYSSGQMLRRLPPPCQSTLYSLFIKFKRWEGQTKATKVPKTNTKLNFFRKIASARNAKVF